MAMVVFALGLTACSSSASSKSAVNSVKPSSDVVALAPSSDVVALAAKFKCDGARPRPEDLPGTGFQPVEIYQCALPKGLNASIVAYTQAQMAKLREPATLLALCRAVTKYPQLARSTRCTARTS